MIRAVLKKGKIEPWTCFNQPRKSSGITLRNGEGDEKGYRSRSARVSTIFSIVSSFGFRSAN